MHLHYITAALSPELLGNLLAGSLVVTDNPANDLGIPEQHNSSIMAIHW